jgi:hypothetical protein
MLLDEAVDQGYQMFSGAGQDEGGGGLIAVELEAGGERRYPDLAHGRVRRDDKLSWRIVEDHVQQAALSFHFKTGVLILFKKNQVVQEAIESIIGQLSKFEFVDHGISLPSAAFHGGAQTGSYATGAHYPIGPGIAPVIDAEQSGLGRQALVVSLGQSEVSKKSSGEIKVWPLCVDKPAMERDDGDQPNQRNSRTAGAEGSARQS